MIYLDNAATTGRKPESVIKAMNLGLTGFSANPGRSGHNKSVATSIEVFNARRKIAEFFGATAPENVIFTANCTASLNYVVKGLLERGDRAVTTNLEHNAVMRPLYKVGADIVTFKVSLSDDAQTIENFKKVITADTKLVIITGASNVLGKKIPFKEIAKICKSFGVKIAVDGAQIAGVEEINMKNDFIDYLCIAPHKGLYASMGVGVLIAEKPIKNTIIEGGTGSLSANMMQPDFMPDRFESGTLNVPGIMTVSAGIDFVKKKGIKNIHNYEMSLCKHFYNQLKGINKVIFYADYSKESNFAPVISFNINGYNSGDVAEILNSKNIAVRSGLHCAPSAHKSIGTMDIGTVRIAPSVFTTRSEIEQTVKIIKNI